MNTNPSSVEINGSTLLEYASGFKAEVNSPFNEWVTGEVVGHTPTWDEKLVHFVMRGGVADYRKRFFEKHPGLPVPI